MATTLAASAVACGDDSDGDLPPDTAEDGGTDATADAQRPPADARSEDDASIDAHDDVTADAAADADEQPDAAPDAAEEDAGTDASEVDASEDAESDAALDGATEDAGDEDAGSDAGEDAGEVDAGERVPLRIMAANLSSGNYQSYDPGHGLRLMRGVNPDVVLIQEMNYGNNSEAAISGMVQSSFPGFFYYRESGAQIPNGVISRYPLLASGEWKDPEVNNRDFAWARIDIPGPRDLWAVSVHLLTSSSGKRNAEANALVQYIRANVPEGDYLAIGGDFNTDSFAEPALTTLGNVINFAGPHPADHNGATGTNASRSKPYDQVLIDVDLTAVQTSTVIGASIFPNGLVLDSRVYVPIDEIAPALTGDSAASNMQHMGVVRSFLVPLH